MCAQRKKRITTLEQNQTCILGLYFPSHKVRIRYIKNMRVFSASWKISAKLWIFYIPGRLNLSHVIQLNYLAQLMAKIVNSKII